MKVYVVAREIYTSTDRDNVILVASSIERAQELAQVRAHAMGFHIYRWAESSMVGYAANSKYIIKEYEVDEANLK